MAEYHLRRDIGAALTAPTVQFVNDPPTTLDTISAEHLPIAWDASLVWDTSNLSQDMAVENPSVSMAAQTPLKASMAGQIVVNRDTPSAWTLSGEGGTFMDWTTQTAQG